MADLTPLSARRAAGQAAQFISLVTVYRIIGIIKKFRSLDYVVFEKACHNYGGGDITPPPLT